MVPLEIKALEITTEIVTAAVQGSSHSPVFDETGGKRLGNFFGEVFESVLSTIQQHNTDSRNQ